MKTAAELVPAQYIDDGRGKTPSPPLKRKWSELRKLRWVASLIMSENPQLKIYVLKGRYWVAKEFQYGLFQLSFNTPKRGSGHSAMDFNTCWDLLTGIGIGLDFAKDFDEDNT